MAEIQCNKYNDRNKHGYNDQTKQKVIIYARRISGTWRKREQVGRLKKRWDIRILIDDSLCCTVETHTTLESNYPPK